MQQARNQGDKGVPAAAAATCQHGQDALKQASIPLLVLHLLSIAEN
jgi:hypothetical protein